MYLDLLEQQVHEVNRVTLDHRVNPAASGSKALRESQDRQALPGRRVNRVAWTANLVAPDRKVVQVALDLKVLKVILEYAEIWVRKEIRVALAPWVQKEIQALLVSTDVIQVTHANSELYILNSVTDLTFHDLAEFVSMISFWGLAYKSIY